MIVVTNAGPLIALAQIGRLNLLQLLYDQLYLPPAVFNEVVTFGRERPGAAEVETADWIRVINISDISAVERLRERLDMGESEAIVLAIELEANLLLIDEARGRRVAQAQGLNHVGTVGLLVLARQRGLIAAVSPLLDELITSGFRMNEELYRTAQRLAGEAEE
jgi:predicted nucleic acid-binding protein